MKKKLSPVLLKGIYTFYASPRSVMDFTKALRVTLQARIAEQTIEDRQQYKSERFSSFNIFTELK